MGAADKIELKYRMTDNVVKDRIMIFRPTRIARLKLVSIEYSDIPMNRHSIPFYSKFIVFLTNGCIYLFANTEMNCLKVNWARLLSQNSFAF